MVIKRICINGEFKIVITHARRWVGLGPLGEENLRGSVTIYQETGSAGNYATHLECWGSVFLFFQSVDSQKLYLCLMKFIQFSKIKGSLNYRHIHHISKASQKCVWASTDKRKNCFKRVWLSPAELALRILWEGGYTN